MTPTGRTCQRWDVQYPHTHITDPAMLGADYLFDVMNYCRNPQSTEEQPWCYTTDPEKEHELCDIPMCGNSILSQFMILHMYSIIISYQIKEHY